MSLDVDATPAGPAGQLRVLPRRQRHVLFAVELDQPLEHHRAGRHVDAERQGFGGEHRLDQARGEQLFDRVPEYGQHSGMVGGQAAQQTFPPLVVAEHCQVGVREVAATVVDHLSDLGAFSSVVSRNGDRRHCCTAASQPALENTNVIAGNSPSESSFAITSGRGGGR